MTRPSPTWITEDAEYSRTLFSKHSNTKEASDTGAGGNGWCVAASLMILFDIFLSGTPDASAYPQVVINGLNYAQTKSETMRDLS